MQVSDHALYAAQQIRQARRPNTKGKCCLSAELRFLYIAHMEARKKVNKFEGRCWPHYSFNNMSTFLFFLKPYFLKDTFHPSNPNVLSSFWCPFLCNC